MEHMVRLTAWQEVVVENFGQPLTEDCSHLSVLACSRLPGPSYSGEQDGDNARKTKTRSIERATPTEFRGIFTTASWYCCPLIARHEFIRPDYPVPDGDHEASSRSTITGPAHGFREGQFVERRIRDVRSTRWHHRPRELHRNTWPSSHGRRG